jgi:hypothetical protein
VLFSIYIIDLPTWLLSTTPLYGYADDINIIKSATHPNLDALHNELIDDITSLQTWFSSNCLKPNLSKYQYMFLGTRQQLLKVPDSSKTINIQGKTIHATPSATCLGLRLDPELKWNNHIAYLRKICGYRLIRIARSRRSIPAKVRKDVISATVFSLLDYCDTVYCNCSINLKASLQKVVNLAVRIQSGLKKCDHISSARSALGWPIIQERHITHFNKLVAKCKSHLVPSYLSDLLATNSDIHSHNTRNKYHIPKAHIRSFKYRAAGTANDT